MREVKVAPAFRRGSDACGDPCAVIQAPFSRVNQELVEVIELVITNEIVPKPCGRDKKRSIEDTSEDERIFKRDTLVVEITTL